VGIQIFNELKQINMNGYVDNIEKLSLENNNFRKVLYTTKHSQLVLMSLKPGEDIGEETHGENDQFLRVESGSGHVVIDGVDHHLADGSAIVVPAGAKHNIINAGVIPMKLYTIYSPAHHRDGTVHTTKEEAEKDHEHFDGQTSE